MVLPAPAPGLTQWSPLLPKVGAHTVVPPAPGMLGVLGISYSVDWKN